MEILRPVGQAARADSTPGRLCKRDLCRPAKVFFVDPPVLQGAMQPPLTQYGANDMKTLITLIATRLRAQALSAVSRGLARLVMSLLASRLQPAAARSASARQTRSTNAGGTVIDGEYRRLDSRHNDRW